jgi:cytidylate kinase
MKGSKMIVGISGKMQHGKDTVGEYLITNYGFKRLSFGDKVKEICIEYDNSTPELREYWNKKVAREILDNESRALEVDASMQRMCPGIWKQLTHEECYITKPLHARIRMQRFATDEMRTLDPDCWVRYVMRKYEQEEGGRWVITDMRFRNEAYWIEATENSQLWRVRRPIPDIPGTEHTSETELDDYPFEVFIDNDSTISALHNKVDRIMKRVLRGTRPFATGEEVY